MLAGLVGLDASATLGPLYSATAVAISTTTLGVVAPCVGSNAKHVRVPCFYN